MSTTIYDLLDEYAAMAPNARAKGLYFERLVRRYLLTEPVYAAMYDEVWLWQDWPGREGKVDTGIDLVARRRYDGGLVAIQCKFYAPNHYLQLDDLGTFFTASGKKPFVERLIVSTTDKWSKHAVDALDDQQIPTARIGSAHLADSVIDWSTYRLTDPDAGQVLARKELREHQIEALQDVLAGFDEHDRGQLIMACGTGKTFTSLRIAERVAGRGGSVLFLVPSIALLSQTLREWTQQSTETLRSFAVCSDGKLGRDSEDMRLRDLEIPATTNAEQLRAALASPGDPHALKVFFSTYQSIQVVHDAQAAGAIGEFDLVICDEAHRTAGVIAAGDDASAFVRVHDAEYIRSARRLYMTATPKLYGDSARKKADEASVEIASMDDESRFGTEFHRLGFGQAVERDLLTDYKVLVLAVSEDAVNDSFQKQFAVNGELNLPDAARVAGIYKALSKTAVEGLDESSRGPMRRAVAFSRSIADSKKVRELLDGNAALSRTVPKGAADLVMRAEHVDGTMDILQRGELLDWIKQDWSSNETRILTNARCLSEGVDVPALDAVIFLNSRDSQVDVVQSVGRVMRRAPGKDYGYIILPVAVPAGQTPEQALDDNVKYKVIWDVLRALRAHDERFAATVEAIRLNPSAPNEQIQVIGVGSFESNRDADAQTGATGQAQLDFTPLGEEWNRAVYARIVRNVGEREYWENWASNVADVANRQRARLEALLDTRVGVRKEFARFVKGLRANLNESISDEDALDMLAQHIITEPVLEILFEGYSFREHNPVAASMERMLAALEGTNVDSELRELDDFYAGVKRSVGQITDAQGKQRFLKQLYERFFRIAMKKASDRLGIVYTPNEIVDFILRSVDELHFEHFGKRLADEGVHILDPFTGTGTFLAQLMLDEDLMPTDKLPHKFRHELWANEISLLAYYVAAVNLEQSYRSRMGGNYVSFPHIALTDTFQNTEDGDALDGDGVFESNNAVVVAENAAPISVIIGNPPYSKGQESGNDDNQNLKYPTLDALIKRDYADTSSAKNKNNLYDSYIRAIRWGTARLGDEGILAYVTNGGFIDSNTADGMRKALLREFSDVYVLNLRGNQRTAGEQSRKEGGKVFDAGSRATIAIVLCVKAPHEGDGRLHYWEVPDYQTREEKLAGLRLTRLHSRAAFERLVPNSAGDWTFQRSEEFESFRSLGRSAPRGTTVLGTNGRGLESGRDSWVYGSDSANVRDRVAFMIGNFNDALGSDSEAPNDPTRISWSRSLRRQFAQRRPLSESGDYRLAMYRPFNTVRLYFDEDLNHERGQQPSLFPEGLENYGFSLTSPSSHYPRFACIATRHTPDVHLVDTGQFFPRYRYESTAAAGDQLSVFTNGAEYERIDNVTDEILAEYRRDYDAAITKDDIFHFVYGVLHSPEYRERFAADLKRTLPRIPRVGDFWAFARAGAELMDLHLNYERADLYPLGGVPSDDDHLRVEKKMTYGGKRGVDKTTLHYNEHITLTGIPERVQEYKLGSRSALDWIIDRYYVRVDKASGIVNDANMWGIEHGDPRYILELVQRIITVSLRTVDIVESLPPLDIRTD